MPYKKIRQIMADHIGCDPKRIHMESSFGELGIDLTEDVELLMALEDAFGIELEREAQSVWDLVKLISDQSVL